MESYSDSNSKKKKGSKRNLKKLKTLLVKEGSILLKITSNKLNIPLKRQRLSA